MRSLLVLALALAPGLAAAEPKIVIDAGHGGTDPGGVGTGAQEKAIVLDVSKRFKALLDADTADTAGGGAWASRLTRGDDTFISLAARSQYSNNQGADRFMSIHANAFGSASANGTETFSFSGTGQGAALRNLVQQEMIAAWGLTNRGNKTANFAVLRDTAAPAELHELAFITNATDAAKLLSEDEREKAAIAHLRAIQRHYDITPYVPGAPVDERGTITGFVIDDLGPVANATLELDTGEQVTTPEDGSFTFENVAAGARMVSASAERHEPKTVELSVAQGVLETEIELVREIRVGDPPVEDPDAPTGGCSTTGDAGIALLVIGLLVWRRRP